MSDYTIEDVKEDIADLKDLTKRRPADCVEKLIVWLAERELERTSNKKQDIEPGIFATNEQLEGLKLSILETMNETPSP